MHGPINMRLHWYCFSSIEPQHNGVCFVKKLSKPTWKSNNMAALALQSFSCVSVVVNSFSLLSVFKYCTVLTVHVFTISWHFSLQTFVITTPWEWHPCAETCSRYVINCVWQGAYVGWYIDCKNLRGMSDMVQRGRLVTAACVKIVKVKIYGSMISLVLAGIAQSV